MLNEAFQIRKVAEKPEEITMYHFLDCISEARRRDYILNWNRLVEASRLWLYNYSHGNNENLHFNFTEKIISEKGKKGYWFLLVKTFLATCCVFVCVYLKST